MFLLYKWKKDKRNSEQRNSFSQKQKNVTIAAVLLVFAPPHNTNQTKNNEKNDNPETGVKVCPLFVSFLPGNGYIFQLLLFSLKSYVFTSSRSFYIFILIVH